MTSLQYDENLKALSDTLYELTKYDNDLRVFFETCITCNSIIKSDRENLEEVFNTKLGHNENNFQNDIKKDDSDLSNDLKEVFDPNQGRNKNNFKNDIKNGFHMSKGPETTLDPKPDYNENNFQNGMGKIIAMYMIASKPASNYNNSQIGNQKLNHSTETKLTADLIYEFLKLEKNSIQLNISKLSDELQQIVNCLLGIEAPQPDDADELLSLFSNNNNKSNTNGQNQNDEFSQFDLTKRNLSNELQNSNSQQKSDNKQVNTEEQSTKELVSLTTDQFKDLIYYLIVLAVAQTKRRNRYLCHRK